ncbi:MAG: SDR family NAD(P)-dependent oxidoreductase [Clostridia bacterium]|nr:SDR family NAD(P)-dependent oxidoreductase [Clostridia bacterium]
MTEAKQKSVLITGVSGGMGRAAAEKFLSAGYKVFGLDVKPPEGLEKIRFFRTDLRSEQDVLSAAQAVKSECPRLDAVVNAAGIYDMNSLVEISEADFIRIFDINLGGAYRVNRAFLPLLEDGGRIIVITSELAPLDPLPFTGLYGITKTALEKYTFSLRMELQLIGKKVSVVRPGAVKTGLLDVSTDRLERFTSETRLYSYNAARFRSVVNKTENRSVPPEKIAEVIYRAATAKRPRYVYSVNRNPALRLLSALPARLQTGIIRMILKK